MKEVGTTSRTTVLVEGDSDAGAVRALAARLGAALHDERTVIVPAGGVTNFGRLLGEVARFDPNASVCGMYDISEERFVRRGLRQLGVSCGTNESLDAHGFFACVDDLEDELIRALGPDAVESVLAAEGELVSFRRFQAMQQQRDRPIDTQLHRFMGTRATRKVRLAALLVETLDLDALPTPLTGLATRLGWL